MKDLDSGPFRGMTITGEPPDRLFGAGVAVVGLFFTDRADSFVERRPSLDELRELALEAEEAARVAGSVVIVDATILPPDDGRRGWQLLVTISEPRRH